MTQEAEDKSPQKADEAASETKGQAEVDESQRNKAEETYPKTIGETEQ